MTTLPGEGPAHALGAALEALGPEGVGVFEVEDGAGLWEVGGYFEGAPPDGVALALLAAAHGAAPFAVSRLDDRDWVAQVQRELVPVQVPPFFVHGPHDRHRVPVNAVPLLIEAAMAFGTGHHATTTGCLEALGALMRRGAVRGPVADIGCGTGILAIAAARGPRLPAVATDIDPVAAATARANAAVNGVAGLVRTGVAAGVRARLIAERAPYGLVFANILAGALRRLAPGIAGITAPGGHAILSGLLVRQAAAVEAVWRGHGFRRVRTFRSAGWATLLLRKVR